VGTVPRRNFPILLDLEKFVLRNLSYTPLKELVNINGIGFREKRTPT